MRKRKISSYVVYDFCFDSCKMSQNVAFRIYLHEVNSKFHVNRHFRREAFMLYSFSDISLDETFTAVKINEAVGKRV